MPDFEPPPAWRKELAAERHLQPLVAGSVLVRGTAAALHAKLQQSIDRANFATVLERCVASKR